MPLGHGAFVADSSRQESADTEKNVTVFLGNVLFEHLIENWVVLLEDDLLQGGFIRVIPAHLGGPGDVPPVGLGQVPSTRSMSTPKGVKYLVSVFGTFWSPLLALPNSAYPRASPAMAPNRSNSGPDVGISRWKTSAMTRVHP